jgi:hypothetical protein
MRMFLKALTVVALVNAPAVMSAQSLLGKPTAQHATVTASASAPAVALGGRLTLWADVSPYPSIHIYAAGAKEFTPVSLVLTPSDAVKAGKPAYPKPDAQSGTGSDAAPVYGRRFRIAVPVTIAPAAPKGSVSISGAVNYQACDDRLCYPVASAPVSWTVDVR